MVAPRRRLEVLGSGFDSSGEACSSRDQRHRPPKNGSIPPPKGATTSPGRSRRTRVDAGSRRGKKARSAPSRPGIRGRRCDMPRVSRGGVLAGIAVVACLVPVVAPPPLARAEAAPDGTPASRSEPTLRAPLLRGEFTVPYPEGAEGEATVIVELLVDRDGQVSEARVVAGEEPFASAVAAAATGLRFEPARRGDAAVAARIRVEVRVAAPAPSPSEPPPTLVPSGPPALATERAPSPSSTGAAPKAVEITVRGDGAEPGGRAIARSEVRVLPGAFGDPLRAVESLPGTVPLASGVPYFYVRGAPPGDVGYFIDGIRIPLLYHLALGPSVLNPAFIDRVELFPGGYPARFGRFAGGIVAATTRAPAAAPRAEGTLRVIDAGGLVETPVAAGEGHLAGGGRWSYAGPVARLFAPDLRLKYWDYQLYADHRVGRRNEVGVLAFGSYDLMGEREGERTALLFATEFHRVDLRCQGWLPGGGRIRHAVTLGHDRSRCDAGRRATARSLAARVDLDLPLSPRARWRAGADGTVDEYRNRLAGFAADVGFADLFTSRTDAAVGAYADLVIELARGSEITPGLRIDGFFSAGAAAAGVDPRFQGRFPLSRRVAAVHALGLAHQLPGFVAPGPALQIGGLRGGLQRSVQASSGLELRLPEDWLASITAFDAVFLRLSDPLGTQAATTTGPGQLDARGLGSAVGLELLVRRQLTRRVGGFLAYTLSRSGRYRGREEYRSQYDRPHVASGALSGDLGRGFRLGARGVAYSGIPLYVDGRPLVFGRRLPAFFRLDWRAEKRWRVGAGASLSLVLEVQNTTLQREVIAARCVDPGSPGGVPSAAPPTCEWERLGPVTLPSIGIEGTV